MKKIIFTLFVSLPFTVSAASVQVWPTITATHGGTKSAKDLTVCIDQGVYHECSNGVPTFVLPTEELYTVTAVSTLGYDYILGAGCLGIPTASFTKCNINWTDGAPIVIDPITPVIAPISPPTASTTPAMVEAVKAPVQMQDIIVPAIIPTVMMPTQAIESTDTSQAEQIATLRAQIIELYKILIALLSQKLAAIK